MNMEDRGYLCAAAWNLNQQTNNGSWGTSQLITRMNRRAKGIFSAYDGSTDYSVSRQQSSVGEIMVSTHDYFICEMKLGHFVPRLRQCRSTFQKRLMGDR